jgi:hypothetical protein
VHTCIPPQILHPTITFGRYRDWDGITPFPSPPLFYEGADQFTGDTLTEVSNDVLRLCDEIRKRYPAVDLDGVKSVRTWYETSYGDDIEDKSSMHRVLNTNKGYRGLTHPCKPVEPGNPNAGYVPNFGYRYISEDIPCGLLVIKGIAELFRVQTPTIDRILSWAQRQMSKEYLVEGGLLQGKDVADGTTRCPQAYGITDTDTFMRECKYVVSSSVKPASHAS